MDPYNSGNNETYSQNITNVRNNTVTKLSEAMISTLKSASGLIEQNDEGDRAQIIIEVDETSIGEDGGFKVVKKKLSGNIGKLHTVGYPNAYTDRWAFVWEYQAKEVWNLVSRSLQEGDELEFDAEFINGCEVTSVNVFREIGKRGRGADGTKTRQQVGHYILSAVRYTGNEGDEEV